jgi:hypothetical protein
MIDQNGAASPRRAPGEVSTPTAGTWRVKVFCGSCRRRFLKLQRFQRFCSEGCRKRAWATAQKNTFPCPICQNDFVKVRPHQAYCSQKCRWQAWFNRKAKEG